MFCVSWCVGAVGSLSLVFSHIKLIRFSSAVSSNDTHRGPDLFIAAETLVSTQGSSGSGVQFVLFQTHSGLRSLFDWWENIRKAHKINVQWKLEELEMSLHFDRFTRGLLYQHAEVQHLKSRMKQMSPWTEKPHTGICNRSEILIVSLQIMIIIIVDKSAGYH